MTIKHTQQKNQFISDEEILKLSRVKIADETIPFSLENEEEIFSKPNLTADIDSLTKSLVNKTINFDDMLKSNQKTAYPNADHYMHVPGQHNTDKWLQAIKDIYYKENSGEARDTAIKQITAGWAPNETYDFLNWLKFYEGSNHLKYKVAQTWYTNDAPGYFLHIKPDANKVEAPVTYQDLSAAKDSGAGELSSAEKKKLIEKQRNKIIGRLDSTEKLLRSEEGQLFAGKELESLMETIYNLKKKVQLVNKISTSVRLYEDMIVREANVLVKNGFSDAAEVLYTLAEDAKKDIPNPTPPAPPSQGSGSAGGGVSPVLPASPNSPEAVKNDTSPGAELESDTLELEVKETEPTTPAAPAAPAAPDSTKEPESNGIKQFKENIKKPLFMGVVASVYDDDLEVIDGEELFVEAQDAGVTPAPTAPPVSDPAPIESPEPAVTAPAPAPAPAPVPAPADTAVPVEEELEVTEDVTTDSTDAPGLQDFDNKVNDLFSNITLKDVVDKLEDLAKIFKTREVPRQLAIVDMMLDSLGLASYFPSLSEATNKALESNNYISTRVDDILSKLHGAMKTKKLDLTGESTKPITSPEVESIKSNLEEEQEKEKTRKELRKQKQDEELVTPVKETPEIEVEEDLGTTVEPTAPVAPPAPPAAAPAPAPAPTVS